MINPTARCAGKEGKSGRRLERLSLCVAAALAEICARNLRRRPRSKRTRSLRRHRFKTLCRKHGLAQEIPNRPESSHMLRL